MHHVILFVKLKNINVNNILLIFIGYQLSDAGFDVWLYNYRVAGMSKNVKDPRTGLVPRLADLNWDFW